MVDGETYGYIKSFCYLGESIEGDGGADIAATARIRNGWIKFRELLPFLTPTHTISSTAPTYAPRCHHRICGQTLLK